MHTFCGIISLSVFMLPILKLWTLQKNIKKKIRMYPTTVVCLRNANSTRSRMAAWCHALSLAVQRLPAMNTVSFLSKSHHFWLAVFIDGNHCTAKDRAWPQPAIRLLVEFAFLRQTIVVRYIQIFEKYFSAESR